jgi:outer membrane protein assembly factor BamB
MNTSPLEAQRSRALIWLSIFVLLSHSVITHAGDWPQWNGPHRDGHADEKGLLTAWPQGGPKLLWSFKDGGTGFSAPAVVGNRIYMLGARAGDELIIALDSAGHEVWSAKIAPPFNFDGNVWINGPNSTPAVDGELLYALGSQGALVCVESATGKQLWRKDLPKELAAEVNPITGGEGGWGFNWSPLVEGDELLITPGGRNGLAAGLDKITGKVRWQTKELAEQCTYASPIVATAAGVRQYIVPRQGGAVGIEPKTGKVLWTYKTARPWPDIVAPTPLFRDDQVYLTAWFGGSDVFKIEKDAAGLKTTRTWANMNLSNAHGGVILQDDYLYGAQELRSWRCLDFKTGERKWEDMESVGPGSIVAVDGMMLILSQDTNIVSLVQMSPAGMKVTGQFPLPTISKLRKPEAKAFSHLVVAGGRLYVREQEMLFCYDLK